MSELNKHGEILVLTHWYLLFGILKLKNLYQMVKLETKKKKHVLSTEILETESPKN